MAIKLRHQEIYNGIVLGLLTQATGVIFVEDWTRAVQINTIKNEYTFDYLASAYDEEDGDEYCFIVTINNDYIRVCNDNEKFDFTTVTYYFSGCRVAIGKES